jgi:Bacterial toxin 44
MRVPGSSNESLDAEQAISYDLWSNIHYGYVGTDVGLSADVLHDGAKLADLLGNDEISPFDVVAVQLGIDLRYTYEPRQLTAYHVLSAVMSQLPKLAEAGGFRHVRPFIPGGPRMEW